MSLFLLTFFLLYGGMHFYFLLKLQTAFSIPPWAVLGFSFFFLLMILAPLLVHLLENKGLETSARVMAYAGYTWMGALFLFFSASLLFDVLRILVSVAEILSHRQWDLFAAAQRPAFLLSCCWAIGTATYGYFEARNIRIGRVTVVSPKIPQSLGKLTIVQISDVHLGLIVRRDRLATIVERIKSAQPDMLVSTGDLVDGQINQMTGMAELFQEIRPRYGKFAVTGNHEFYAGLQQSLGFTERAGFKVLRDERITIEGLITIAGVDDPAGDRSNASSSEKENVLLSTVPAGTFTLFLKHRPVVVGKNLGLFDLQLSGHIHKGQIFPFILISRLFYHVKSGYSTCSQNSALYLSRGTGTWGPPIRFLAPPEVTVIELIPPPAVKT